MIKAKRVIALGNHRIRVTYADGSVKEADLSNLIGRGVFKELRDEQRFKEVYVGDCGQIAWSNEMEICADAIY